MNDVKCHKIVETKKVFSDGIYSYIVHFDFYNGNAAIINLSKITEDNVKWEHRKQFENQPVFSIPSETFKWILTDAQPNYKEIVY